MNRVLVLGYGVACYVLFLGVFLYTVGFVGGFLVPTRLTGPAISGLAQAIAVNAGLICIFAIQHSVMARPWFKQHVLRIMPQAMERSTYVLASSAALVLLFWQWRPMGDTLWSVQNPAFRTVIWGLFAAGWLTVLYTTFLINHFDLFGLRQVWLYFRDRDYTPLAFVTPGPYRYTRHPLYLGWMLAFWATPAMSVAQFIFAAGMTVYILVAIRYEERDLVRYHGTAYEQYRRRVPMLLVKFPSRPAAQLTEQTPVANP
jgi:methanethiol S-methyltransferase